MNVHKTSLPFPMTSNVDFICNCSLSPPSLEFCFGRRGFLQGCVKETIFAVGIRSSPRQPSCGFRNGTYQCNRREGCRQNAAVLGPRGLRGGLRGVGSPAGEAKEVFAAWKLGLSPGSQETSPLKARAEPRAWSACRLLESSPHRRTTMMGTCSKCSVWTTPV